MAGKKIYELDAQTEFNTTTMFPSANNVEAAKKATLEQILAAIAQQLFGDFMPDHIYRQGQIVKNDGVIWTAKADFTSAAEFDENNWDDISVPGSLLSALESINDELIKTEVPTVQIAETEGSIALYANRTYFMTIGGETWFECPNPSTTDRTIKNQIEVVFKINETMPDVSLIHLDGTLFPALANMHLEMAELQVGETYRVIYDFDNINNVWTYAYI
jgi:hypothetical protein